MYHLSDILSKIIKDNPQLVDNWRQGKPGSWGALAAKAVIAAKKHYGRNLTGEERRMVWQVMWNALHS